MEEEDEEVIRLDHQFPTMEEKDEEEIRFVSHFSPWMKEDVERIRDSLVNRFSLWRRKMRMRSGLLTTFLYGGGR